MTTAAVNDLLTVVTRIGVSAVTDRPDASRPSPTAWTIRSPWATTADIPGSPVESNAFRKYASMAAGVGAVA